MRKQIEIKDGNQILNVEYSENNGQIEIHVVWINVKGCFYYKKNEDVIILYCDENTSLMDCHINITPYSQINIEKVKQVVINKISE